MFKVGDIVYVRPGLNFYNGIGKWIISGILGVKLKIIEIRDSDYFVDYYGERSFVPIDTFVWLENLLIKESEYLKYYRPCLNSR